MRRTRRGIVYWALSASILLPGAICSAGPLQEQLYELDQLTGTAAMANGEVERRVAMMCSQFGKEDWGRIYAAAASAFAQSGRAYTEKTIKYCQQALAANIDPLTASQLYVYYGDATQLSAGVVTGQALARQRRLAAQVYLEGLKRQLSMDLPETPPQLPDLGSAGVIRIGDPKAAEQFELDSRKRREAWERAKLQQELIKRREVLMGQIVDMYSKFPYDNAELQRMAQEALGDSFLVGELVRRIDSSVKVRVDKVTGLSAALDKTVESIEKVPRNDLDVPLIAPAASTSSSPSSMPATAAAPVGRVAADTSSTALYLEVLAGAAVLALLGVVAFRVFARSRRS